MDKTDALIVMTKLGHIGRVGAPKYSTDPDAKKVGWKWHDVFLGEDEPEIRIGPGTSSSPYAIWASDELHAYQQLLAAHEGREINEYNFYCDATEDKDY